MDAAAVHLKYSEEGVRVLLGPSRRAVAGLAAMALATLVLLTVTPGLIAVRIVLATAVVCAALESAHTALARRSVRMRRSGEIEVQAAGRPLREGRVREGSFVAPWLTIILWRPEGARLDRALLVLPDMLPAEDFRRLRVLLRWA